MSDETTNAPEAAEDQDLSPREPQDDGLPANQVTVEDAGPSQKKVTIEIDRARIDAKFDEIFGELRTTAQVPGFRIGRAPRRLLEKRFGKEADEDVRNSLVAAALREAVESEDLKILGEPDLKLDEIQLPDSGNLVFSVEVEVTPEFDLPDYKKIPVTEPSIEVTDARLAETTRNILASRGALAPTDEPAMEGDQVIADVKVTGEGVDESRDNAEYLVSPGAVLGVPLEDLGDKLTGATAGKTVELSATVPDSHENEDWRGAEVTVTFDVKEVKRLEVPELTDELAGEFGLDSADAFRELVSQRLEAELTAERRQSMRRQVCQYLLDNTKLELPEGVATRQTARVLQRRYVDLLYRGVPREQIDQNLELLEAHASEQAAEQLRLTFILHQVAEAEEVTVDEGEVNARIAEMAVRRGRRPERLRNEMANEGTLGEVEVQIREQKAIDKLLDMAEITAEKPAAAAEAAEAAEVEGEAKTAKKTAEKTAKKTTKRKSDD